MAILFSHITALEYWCWKARTWDITDCMSYAYTKEAPQSFLTEEVLLACEEFHNPENPVNILVASKNGSHLSASIQPHVFKGTLPPRSVCKAWKDVYVSSPEMAFMQTASRLNRIDALVLCCELMGTYTTTSEGILGTRNLIMTQRSLERFLQNTRLLHGANISRQVLKHSIPGSASPMETEVALTLSLPRMLGGYGLPKPKLNQEIPLSKTTRFELERNSIKVDLYWPESKLAVEYESNRWHSGESKFILDSIRRNDIRYLGFDVTTLTLKEFDSMQAMDRFSKNLAERLKVRIRTQPTDYFSKKLVLKKQLLKIRHEGNPAGYLK